MASAMDVDEEEVELPTSSSSKGEKKRFEVKKVNGYNLKTVYSLFLLCYSGMQLLCGHGVCYCRKLVVHCYD